MLRYLTNKIKQHRKSVNYDAVKSTYARGAMSLPADRLICHQPSDPERVEKIKAQAEVRRQRRLAT